jgi:glucose-1-phosphate adenylyltransferase
MIMAGGKGSRLVPLTCHRAKPSVPFGGRYRIIDFVLSNFINSGHRSIYVLTQYMASSLIKHISRNWHLSGMGEFIEIVPAQMRTGEHWYRGTADAIFQNLNLIRDSRAEHIAVFGGDHIYKFAVDQMEQAHVDLDADLTVAAWPVPRDEASGFGIIQVDETGRVIGFQEKPSDPAPMPGRPDHCLVSMGNYLFKSGLLQRALIDDAADPDSSHDFGKDVIPRMLAEGRRIYTYDFGENTVVGEPEGARPYWRDVGTIDSYFRANMELRSPLPTVNLYNRRWRIRTAQRDYPPARFVRHRGGQAVDVVDSLVCEGSIVQSARLIEAVLGYDCFVHNGATVRESVLLSGCDIGEHAMVQNAVLDKNCTIEPGARVGFDPDEDRRRFPFVSDEGRVILPKGTVVPAKGPIRFAHDIGALLRTDPHTRDRMEATEGAWTIAETDRHSYVSAGPRYQRGAPATLPPIKED